MLYKIALCSLISLALCLTACAPRIGGSDYSMRGVGEVSTIKTGFITSMRRVNVLAKSAQDNSIGAGSLLGGLGGAVLGSQIGQGKGSVLAGTLGAVGGAVAGHYAEKGLTDQEGFEYTIKLDNGETVSVTQGLETALTVGQRVNVIYSGRDRSRVTPA